MAEFLIAKGADLNAKDNEGYPHLSLAANNGLKDVAELLASN
jgi:ankyrin repeat protein